MYLNISQFYKHAFLKVVASAIVDKYIGESARIIREMFAYAKEYISRQIHQIACFVLILLNF